MSDNTIKSQTVPEEISILFVHHGRVLGGAPKSLISLVNELAKDRKYKITILCPNRAIQEYFIKQLSQNTQVYILAGFSHFMLGRLLIGYAPLLSPKSLIYALIEGICLPRSILRLRRQFKDISPDIIHSNSSILFASAIAAKLAKLPHVWHIRERQLLPHWALRYRLDKLLLTRLADKLIFISPAEASSFGIAPSASARIIHNSIDIDQFIEDTSQAPILPGNTALFTGITLGGSSFRKGLAEILEAFISLPTNHRLIILGGCIEYSNRKTKSPTVKVIHRLEDFLIKIGAKKHRSWFYSSRIADLFTRVTDSSILCVGNTVDVANYLKAADYLIFGGTTPHYPRPIYEAWLAKKPIISFRSEGIENYVVSADYGIILPQNSANELKEAILNLKSNSRYAQQSASLGFNLAIETFDQRKNAKKVAEVYERLLQSKFNLT